MITNTELKKRIDVMYKKADEITTSGIVPEGTMSIRDMLKFDMLQYLCFLYEPLNANINFDVEFVMNYLSMYMTKDKFLSFRYERCLSKEFINTVPRSLTYFAKYDLSGKSVRDENGKASAKAYAELFDEMGAEFIADNGSTTIEVGNLTNYMNTIYNYLRDCNLYNTGKPNEPISASTIKSAKNRNDISGKMYATAKNKTSDGKPIITEEEDDKTLEDYLEELNSLIGLDAVKNDLYNLINLIKIKNMRKERDMKQPDITLHMVFSGNPGTGKTTVARLLAKIYKKLGVVSQGQLVEVDRSDLVVGYIGQTAAKTAEVIDSAIGGILFIDEAYTLTAGKDSKDFGQEAVDTLLKRMEDNRDDLVVIVAGYTDLMAEFVESNPGLKSRFNKNIFFSDYSGEELNKIFLSMSKKQDYTPNKAAAEYILDYLTKRALKHDENFANAREVRNYLERCIERQASRLVTLSEVTDAQLKTLTKKDVEEELPQDSLPDEEL